MKDIRKSLHDELYKTRGRKLAPGEHVTVFSVEKDGSLVAVGTLGMGDDGEPNGPELEAGRVYVFGIEP